MSSVIAPGQGLGQAAPGVGGDALAGAGMVDAGATDLDQLQQAYNRTGDRGSQHHPIAEFLYQLTKMLTDDNSEIIEWVDGRIKVHHPERLESEVLHKYFRHSKFASFQRQLNYFGFRKIAGKGKMSPCSYVNEAATSDIRSLLLIKRKTNGSAARKAAMAQRTMQLPTGVSHDLRANLSALAAGAAAATGQPGMNRLGNPAFGAAALFAQGPAAAAAGLGQFPSALQQNLQQKSALGGNFLLGNDNSAAMANFLMSQNQNKSSAENLLGQQVTGFSKTPSAPSIEQLHAQLAASLANRQQSGLTPQLNPSSNLGLATSALNSTAAAAAGGAAAAAAAAVAKAPGVPGTDGAATGPASAALNATAALNKLQQQQAGAGGGGPASAALSAAAAGGAAANSLFDSAANLKSLVGDQQKGLGGAPAPTATSALGASAASQQLLSGRLPSSNTLFPENLSTASFGNLLASSNRLSSLLSLNSFLSRDPSTADLLGVGVLPQGSASAQLAASQAASQAAAAAGMENKFGVRGFQ